MNFIKFLLVALLISLLFGQVVRIQVSESSAITPTDLLVLMLGLVFTIHSLTLKRSIKLPKEIFSTVSLFSLAAFASLTLASPAYSLSQLLVSSMFLVRFILYFYLAIIFYNIVRKDEIKNWINLTLGVGLVFSLIGFGQLLLFPDLSFLVSFGWDPHIRRIATSFLDPNFSGGLLAVLIAISLSLFLATNKKSYFAIFAIYLGAIILTFSRSSYLALIVTLFTIGLLKSPKTLVSSLLFLTLVFWGISPVKERVVGAFTLDETARARLQSWSQAITIFKDNYLFGVGFNTYRFAQAKYGFFTADQPLGGHSGAGTDSSILLVAATTGVFGSIFFLSIVFAIIKLFAKSAKSSYLHLASLASFLGLLVHSQFVNSLFFPQIMLIIWMMVGLTLRNDS